MTFVRLIASRGYCHWSHILCRQSRGVLARLPLPRYLSATRILAHTGDRDDGKTGAKIRFLEQTDDGKLADYSNSQNETAALKARIEELEGELKQYADKAGLQDAHPNEVFGDIFDRMPEDLQPRRITREDLKNLIMKGDPQAMDYEGAAELAREMEEGDDEEYDLDKVLHRLPEDMRAEMTKDRLRKMLVEKDPSIQQYLLEEIEYDLDATYDRLPVQMKDSLTKDQVSKMIIEQDPAIANYLCEVDRGYDLNHVYNTLPEEKKAVWSRDTVEEMIANEDPAIRDHFQQATRDDLDEDSMLGDAVDRAEQEMKREDQAENPPHMDIPEHVRVHMNSFNKLLGDNASQNRDSRSVASLWAKYEVCKTSVPGFLEEIPSQVWDILWEGQWNNNAVPESRKNRLWTLVTDMVEVDHALSHDQRLVYIEYEFSEGSTSEAMRLWRQEYTELEQDHPKRDDYRDLGVRLHVEAGMLDKAQDLIFGKQRRNSIRASDVATLIAAKASKNDEANLKTAWSLYLDMRERLGNKIKLEDFDQIAMTFLGANRPNLALAVFKDMVLCAGPRPSDPETQFKCLALLRQLQDRAMSTDELASITLESLTSIPKQLENKYFYASWIKRLIGLGEVDTTIQVLELMFQRGIRPDARHINGIIGAWLRGPEKNKHQLALQIGWSMVNQRLKFVARRNNSTVGNLNVVDSPDVGKLVPPYISQNLPTANIETFCLLLLYYQRRSMAQSVDNITSLLREAEITPNSFFMNHLIFAELRKQNIGQAWKIYSTGIRQISPDLETFSALWNCEKVFTSGRSSNASEFPRSRRLFRIMSEWFHKLEGRRLNGALEAFDAEMFNEIIRCFCFQKDTEGTIVALYGLRDMFNAYPNPETERIVLIQLSRIGEGSVPRGRRARASHRFSANANSIKDFEKITKVAQLVKDMRVQALADVQIEDSALTGRQRKEEDLFRLVEILKISLRHSAGLEMNQVCPQEEQIGNIAEEMGVSRISMIPPDITSNE